MFNTLKFKISVAAFILISIIMAITTWQDIRSTENKLLTAQMEKVALLSDRISHGIMVLMLKNRWQDLQSMMEGLVKDGKELKEIRIFTPDEGVIVVSSYPEEVGEKIYPVDMERFKSKEENVSFIKNKSGERFASKLTEIRNQPICHRCHDPKKDILGVLNVELSTVNVYKSLEKIKKERLLDAVIGFFLIIGVFLFIVGVLVDRPIRKIIRAIKKIESGDLSARLDAKKKDEFGRLAESFNGMVNALEEAGKEIERCHTEQMMRADKLASLGEMASGMAHEIKNPLAGISSAVQVLISELSDEDPKKRIMNEILNQVKRLDRAVRDLLAYARPAPPNKTFSDINSILEKALFFIQQVAFKAQISMDTDFDKSLPEIMVDPDQIQQVFINISINGIQAMTEGGKLSVSTGIIGREGLKKEHPDVLDRRNDWIKISFQDTGTGIFDEDMEKIFQPFFTKKGKGTGLGLAISQRIIEDHGGRIIVEKHKEGGSVFSVYLPVHEKQGEAGN
ncbi:MAG TPA: HAMP domain-containing sensor histidine kinase [Nitrospirae bacterium]|nr:sensor protein ZraS [bacterium BMS3Bbin08]HDK16419.1 HAMP domain-containing sensor histidine kinase [Nitrospirota bacterium]